MEAISTLAHAAVASTQWKLLSVLILCSVFVYAPAALWLAGSTGDVVDALALSLLLPVLRAPGIVGQAFSLEASTAQAAPFPALVRVLTKRGHLWSILYQLASALVLLWCLSLIDIDVERTRLTLPCDSHGEQIGEAGIGDRVASAIYSVAKPLLLLSGPGSAPATETLSQSHWLSRIGIPFRLADDMGQRDPYFRLSGRSGLFAPQASSSLSVGDGNVCWNLPGFPVYLSALVVVALSIGRFYLHGSSQVLQQPDAWFVPVVAGPAAIEASADLTGASLARRSPSGSSGGSFFGRFLRQGRWVGGQVVADVARACFIITPALMIGAELAMGLSRVAMASVVGALGAAAAGFYLGVGKPLLVDGVYAAILRHTSSSTSTASDYVPSSLVGACLRFVGSLLSLLSSLVGLANAVLVKPLAGLALTFGQAFAAMAGLVGIGSAVFAAASGAQAPFAFSFPSILSAPEPSVGFLLFRWLPYLALAWLVALPTCIVVSSAFSFIALVEAAIVRTVLTRSAALAPAAAAASSSSSSTGLSSASAISEALFSVPSPLHGMFLKPLAEGLWPAASAAAAAGSSGSGGDEFARQEQDQQRPPLDGAALLKVRLTALGIAAASATSANDDDSSSNCSSGLASYLLSYPAPTMASLGGGSGAKQQQQQLQQQQYQQQPAQYVPSPWQLLRMYDSELTRVAAATATAAAAAGAKTAADAASTAAPALSPTPIERLASYVRGALLTSSSLFVVPLTSLLVAVVPPFLTRAVASAVATPPAAATRAVLLPTSAAGDGSAASPAGSAAEDAASLPANLALDNLAALLSSDRWASLLPASANPGSTGGPAQAAAAAGGLPLGMTMGRNLQGGLSMGAKPYILSSNPLEAAVMAAWTARMASAEFALHCGDTSAATHAATAAPTGTALSSAFHSPLASALRASLISTPSSSSAGSSPSSSAARPLHCATLAQARYLALRDELVVKRRVDRALGTTQAEASSTANAAANAAANASRFLGYGMPAARATNNNQAAAAAGASCWSPAVDGAMVSLQGPVPTFLRLFVESLFVSPQGSRRGGAGAMPPPFRLATFPSIPRPLSSWSSSSFALNSGAGALVVPTQQKQGSYSLCAVDAMMLPCRSAAHCPSNALAANPASLSSRRSALDSAIQALAGGFEGSGADAVAAAAGGGIGQLVAVLQGVDEDDLARQALCMTNAAARARRPVDAGAAGRRIGGADNLVVAFPSSSQQHAAASGIGGAGRGSLLGSIQLSSSRFLRMRLLQLGLASHSSSALSKLALAATGNAAQAPASGFGQTVRSPPGPGSTMKRTTAKPTAAGPFSPSALPMMASPAAAFRASGVASGLYGGSAIGVVGASPSPSPAKPFAAPVADPRVASPPSTSKGRRAASPAPVPAAGGAAAPTAVPALRSTRKRMVL